MMSSQDKGATWRAPTNMSSSCGRRGDMGYGLSGDTPSDGQGVQLSNGRLVVPMYAGAPAGQTICYSDDHGSSERVAPALLRPGWASQLVLVAASRPADPWMIPDP
jgi:hypothetical protein